MFENVPQEMRAYRQWVVWKLVERENAKATKIPYNPVTGEKASVTDPLSWCEYGLAVYHSTNYSGIGFVLTKADPFGFIDLDDTHGDATSYERQVKVFKEFDSYSELSPSGNGLHIIVKGKVPHGRRRSDIEVYSSERYMTMTGNVYNSKPVTDRNLLLNQLWEQMGGPPVQYNYGDDKEERNTDAEIFFMASEAVNGVKFLSLYNGEFDTFYPSQSEADFALIDIVAFYTQNRAQIARIFRASQLGQRAKAHRIDYVNYMISKSFDRQLPLLDIDGLRIKGESAFSESAATEPSNPIAAPAQSLAATHTQPSERVQDTHRFPPGLVGEVAQFILDASPRQVPIISLAAAIGLLAGICGRAYNVSDGGLNQYIMVVANTGSGKDILSHGPSKLMGYVRNSVPASSEFIGPGELVSGAGVIKHLAKYPCFVSTIGEFGKKLREMSNPKNAHLNSILRLFLQLYSKGGQGQILESVAYSDISKNIAAIASPALTILGEGTPESFYENLDEGMITDGLLPRFLIFEHKGKTPYLSKTHHLARPSFSLVEKLSSLAAECLTRQKMGDARIVRFDAEAEAIFEAYDVETTDLRNETRLEITRQLWNRAHLKALRLAALIAVGINYLDPVITKDEANYCIAMVTSEVISMIDRFANGDVGVMTTHNIDEYKQVKELGKVIAEWCRPENETYSKYKITDNMKKDNVVTHNALQMRLYPHPHFKNDKFGANNAIKKALQYFIDAGDLAEVPKTQMKAKYESNAKAYVITNMHRFVEYLKSEYKTNG